MKNQFDGGFIFFFAELLAEMSQNWFMQMPKLSQVRMKTPCLTLMMSWCSWPGIWGQELSMEMLNFLNMLSR